MITYVCGVEIGDISKVTYCIVCCISVARRQTDWDIDCTPSSLSLGDNSNDVCNIGYCIGPNIICNTQHGGGGGGQAVAPLFPFSAHHSRKMGSHSSYICIGATGWTPP